MIKLKVEGLAQAVAKVKAYQKQVIQATKDELNLTAGDIASQARANCAVPSIASELRVFKWGNIGAEISTSTPYSAYLEFGTGDYAKALLSSYPEDWRALARQFYINGLGRTYSDPYLYPAFIRYKYQPVQNIAKKLS